MAYVWAILACVMAIGQETYFKSTSDSWVRLVPWILVPALVLNYSICQLVRGQGLVAAIMIFSTVNLLLRVGIGLLYLREHISTGTWVAVALMLAAQAARYWGK